MTPPSYAELVSVVRREGEALVAAGRLGLEPDISGCPGWTVEVLLRHVTNVYRYATEILESRATSAPPRPAATEGDAVEELGDALDDLITALRDVSADTPVWNWSTQPRIAGFWARRMAHESVIHRWDAECAHDVAHPPPVDLAADGIEELLNVIVPRRLAHTPLNGLDGTMALRATDARQSWTVKLTPDSVAVTPGVGSADVTLSGKASEILLMLYGRSDLGSVDTEGDPALVSLWRDRVAI